MRRLWGLLILPLALLFGAAGCANPDANLRPPPRPEAYNLPPENDAKFSQPVNYPKYLLWQDTIHVPTGDPNAPPGAGGGHGGGGGGMGGPGGH